MAAERREFDGFRKQVGKVSDLRWAGAKYAAQAEWKGDRWWMVANGPGSGLVASMLSDEKLREAKKENVSGFISTGLCGALDPALRVGHIVVMGDAPATSRPFTSGAVHSSETVVTTAREKRVLRNQTGALAVDMEAATVREKAREAGVPFFCVRAVSDSAGESLPLDFNLYRDARGNFSRSRIALAAMAHPFSVMPQLMAFDRDCRYAAGTLGEFLADCKF